MINMKKLGRSHYFIFAIILMLAVAIWVDLPAGKRPGPQGLGKNLNIRLGLDLQGGAHLIYRASVEGIAATDIDDALSGVRDVIERRVNAFGITEPVIQTNKTGGEHRVIVELAGVHDTNMAIEMIGETPQLDFRREVSFEESLEQFNIDDPSKITGPVFERTDLTGKNLERSTISFDEISGQPQVNLEFDGEGADLFAELTKNNIGKRIAIYLDGIPISAPVVQSEITNGQAVISGGFQLEEAKQLARRLNAGALPVPIELIGQQTVGPALGQKSIEKSVTAGIIGLVAVACWMIIFYRLPGFLATAALVIYAIFFLAIIKILPVTLTLAGIAGFILTVGMAVDANVLIFESFRENLRLGRSVRYSIKEGFADAWKAISASNISSLITALVLYVFGTSIVKGFAVTYGLGIVLSMFTAIVVTKSLMSIVLSYKKTHWAFLLAVKKINEK